jgi:ABC-2 type transport system permease protein
MIRRTVSVAQKEILQIFRDPRTLVTMFLIPLVQLFLLAYAATTDVQHLRMAVFDMDRTVASRDLIAAYRTSNYFDVVAYVASQPEMEKLVDRGDVRAGLVIPAGYSDSLASGRQASISFIIDGTDPTVANTAFAASQTVGQAQGIRVLERRLGISTAALAPLSVESRVWYNPDMKSVNFMVPGLIGTIVFILTMIMTALSIVQERERGTIEQLIITPIQPLELIVGKVIPWVLIAFVNILEVLGLGVFWFHMPINGSVSLLLGLSAIFLMSAVGIGILISTMANTYREAMLVAAFVMLPSIFLSGFFFPIEGMPRSLQFVSYLMPLRYMLTIMRGILLKGVGMEVLRDQVIAMSVFGVAILVIAATRFHKRLE